MNCNSDGGRIYYPQEHNHITACVMHVCEKCYSMVEHQFPGLVPMDNKQYIERFNAPIINEILQCETGIKQLNKRIKKLRLSLLE